MSGKTCPICQLPLSSDDDNNSNAEDRDSIVRISAHLATHLPVRHAVHQWEEQEHSIDDDSRGQSASSKTGTTSAPSRLSGTGVGKQPAKFNFRSPRDLFFGTPSLTGDGPASFVAPARRSLFRPVSAAGEPMPHSDLYGECCKDEPDLDVCRRLIDSSTEMREHYIGFRSREWARFGDTALHAAARTGSVDLLRLLVSKGDFNVNSVGFSGRTCAHIAASTGNAEVLEVLAELGIDFELTDAGGEGPLAYAEKDDCVQFLQRALDPVVMIKSAGKR